MQSSIARVLNMSIVTYQSNLKVLWIAMTLTLWLIPFSASQNKVMQ